MTHRVYVWKSGRRKEVMATKDLSTAKACAGKWILKGHRAEVVSK